MVADKKEPGLISTGVKEGEGGGGCLHPAGAVCELRDNPFFALRHLDEEF